MNQIKRLFLYRDAVYYTEYIIAGDRSLKLSKRRGVWLGDRILARFCPETWHAICPDLPYLKPGEGPREIELSIKFKETGRKE